MDWKFIALTKGNKDMDNLILAYRMLWLSVKETLLYLVCTTLTFLVLVIGTPIVLPIIFIRYLMQKKEVNNG